MRNVMQPQIMGQRKNQTENMDIHEFMKQFANQTNLERVDEKKKVSRSRSRELKQKNSLKPKMKKSDSKARTPFFEQRN